MQKVTKKIFGWLNALRLPASLERHPAELVFMFKPSAASNQSLYLKLMAQSVE